LAILVLKWVLTKEKKFFKDMLGFTFMMHEKNPSEARKIIPNNQNDTVHKKEKELYMVPKYHNEVIQKV